MAEKSCGQCHDIAMKLSLHYLYDREGCDQARHQEILALLSSLQGAGRITEVLVQDHQKAFPTEEVRARFFDQLREFGTRHKVRLGRLFGSNRHRFWWLPREVLLVHEGPRLSEVFPCEVEGNVIEPLDFLRLFNKGQAWTVRSARGRSEGGRHKELVEWICKDPDRLAPGLRLLGSNVHVSREFGESGYIDLVFEKTEGSYLLVEVKVKPDEIDKAIGQVMRHRELFAAQNALDKSRIAIAVACPFVPAHIRMVCFSAGIACFQLEEPVAH